MTDVDRHWRYVIAMTLIVGYVGPAAISFFHEVPANNTRFVDGFFIGLGPIVGAAVAAVLNVGKAIARNRMRRLARWSTSSLPKRGGLAPPLRWLRRYRNPNPCSPMRGALRRAGDRPV